MNMGLLSRYSLVVGYNAQHNALSYIVPSYSILGQEWLFIHNNITQGLAHRLADGVLVSRD